MTFKIHEFLRDFKIEHALPGQSAKVTEGWIGVHCPFCGGDNFKLGYNVKGNGWNCWACGGKNTFKVIERLLSVSNDKAASIYTKYRGTDKSRPQDRQRITGTGLSTVPWPYYCKPIQEPHRAFLRSRNFDPDKIVDKWGIRGTGPIPRNPQQLRIMIPVTMNGEMMCYQGRDITGKARAKYWSLPTELSAKPIKSCLYGYDEAKSHDTVVVCEGPTDVWRLGPGAVALFGVAYRPAQVRLLAEWGRVVMVLDGDDAGYEAASKIRDELDIVGVDCAVMPTFGGGVDPADLTDEDAAAFMRSVR